MTLSIFLAASLMKLAATSESAPPPYSEVAPSAVPIGKMHFRSVLALRQEPGALPQLRCGEVARTAEWPASLFAKFETARGTSVCTAALVGPRAMLTAAHCVPSSLVVSFEFNGSTFVTDCTQHPEYKSKSDLSADFALCQVRSSLDHPNGISLGAGNRFERLNTAPMDELLPKARAPRQYVTLTGYGCVSDLVEENEIDGYYRIGRTFFVDSSDSTTRLRGEPLYAPRQVNNLMTVYDDSQANRCPDDSGGLVTVDDSSHANLCPGDSGGPAFAFKQGTRVIVGVNSRVFYKDAEKTSYGASLVSATGGPSFRKWALQWMRQGTDVNAPADAVSDLIQVCGLGGGTSGCK